MSENDEALLFESLRLELRRGSLILAVLPPDEAADWSRRIEAEAARLDA